LFRDTTEIFEKFKFIQQIEFFVLYFSTNKGCF